MAEDLLDVAVTKHFLNFFIKICQRLFQCKIGLSQKIIAVIFGL